MKKRLNINKTLLTVIGLNIIQILLIFGIILYSTLAGHGSGILNRFDNTSLLLIVILLTAFLNSFFALRDAFILVRSDSQYALLKETLFHVENLNKTLRAQRHDFMNHLQVVYSLIEMDEYVDAKNYIERIYDDIQKVSRVLKTSNAAVNALLQAKLADAEKKGISVKLNISTKLNDLKIPSWEMCRVLANLIDNSVDALETINRQKLLTIELFENLRSYGFRIKNNGPRIPDELKQKIFEPGVTTKGDKGQGMGLAIVREVLSNYNGTIVVESSEEETSFECLISK